MNYNRICYDLFPSLDKGSSASPTLAKPLCCECIRFGYSLESVVRSLKSGTAATMVKEVKEIGGTKKGNWGDPKGVS